MKAKDVGPKGPSEEAERNEVDELLEMSVELQRKSAEGVLSHPNKMQREREIKQAIATLSDMGPLNPDYIMNLRKIDNGNRLVLAEYVYADPPFHFVYIDKECVSPSYMDSYREAHEFPRLGYSGLFRLVSDSALKLIERWDD